MTSGDATGGAAADPFDLGRVLVVIPTYNERENIESIVGRVRANTPAADVLVVDDSSPDGTGELADRMATADAHVRVLHRVGKEGLGAAYIAGFRWALEHGYEVVVEMDADGSHQPEELHRLLGALREATAGYRAFRAATLEKIGLDDVNSRGYCFQVDLALRALRLGLRVVEVPITFVERTHGASKMSRAIVAEAMWRLTVWGVTGRLSRLRR